MFQYPILGRYSGHDRSTAITAIGVLLFLLAQPSHEVSFSQEMTRASKKIQRISLAMLYFEILKFQLPNLGIICSYLVNSIANG